MFRALALSMTAVLGVSSSAFAAEISSLEISSLPIITVVEVSINYGHPMAAVQPTGMVQFKHASCAKKKFSADVETADGIMLVKIQRDPLGLECRGPLVERTYTVQISSDMDPGVNVTVLNPVRPVLGKRN